MLKHASSMGSVSSGYVVLRWHILLLLVGVTGHGCGEPTTRIILVVRTTSTHSGVFRPPVLGKSPILETGPAEPVKDTRAG